MYAGLGGSCYITHGLYCSYCPEPSLANGEIKFSGSFAWVQSAVRLDLLLSAWCVWWTGSLLPCSGSPSFSSAGSLHCASHTPWCTADPCSQGARSTQSSGMNQRLGLQRRVVIAQLAAAAHEVLPLKNIIPLLWWDSFLDDVEHICHTIFFPLGGGKRWLSQHLGCRILKNTKRQAQTHTSVSFSFRPTREQAVWLTLHSPHSHGADVVQATVMDDAALKVELLALALKIFLLKHSHFKERGCGNPQLEHWTRSHWF